MTKEVYHQCHHYIDLPLVREVIQKLSVKMHKRFQINMIVQREHP